MMYAVRHTMVADFSSPLELFLNQQHFRFAKHAINLPGQRLHLDNALVFLICAHGHTHKQVRHLEICLVAVLLLASL